MTTINNQPTPALAKMANGHTVKLGAIPTLTADDFNGSVLSNVARGRRVAAYFGDSLQNSPNTQLYIVLADDEEKELLVGRTEIGGDQFASLTPLCPQVHLFEREIAEQFGLKPVDHPWLKPVRYHHSWTGRDAWDRPASRTILPAVGDFYRIEGEQIHEVSVGPVHAGIIEPGHFRFQCHGEQVYHLEIALGYQHRGVEQALRNGPGKRSLRYAEAVAGDSTIGHTVPYCKVVESLSGCRQAARAQALRGIALELERLANHTGDLGALAGDIGFLPTASYCGRIRGDFLNMTAVMCGNRFGRGLVCLGGVGFDLDQPRVDDLLRRLEKAEKDMEVAINLLWDTQSVMARLENVGIVSSKVAMELGLVGPAARASGLVRDVRQDHPSGIFCFAHIPISTCTAGDVFSRAYVRWLEMQQSLKFVVEQLNALPGGKHRAECGALAPDSLSVALCEGPRGEVCHVGITNEQGLFARYKIVDPSFHNWMGLAMAMRNQQISDFPICNKSFSLSYCGHDL